MNSDKKVFAFKLAEKKEKKEEAKTTKWKAREGVSVAGCSGPDARVDDDWWGADQGYWC
ncbi:hypothetical protein [Pyxidicoccus caerfyrddinensis]|jgi:hypothetical protein|uniref:hypothetical protein n=1 Tax=Pyxidicoccus caerfyrddinensis TaxID=2709663 RepID=UPI00196830FA|nr:hypothetical protein [Pyxidicoccus caerfyrddinensis]